MRNLMVLAGAIALSSCVAGPVPPGAPGGPGEGGMCGGMQGLSCGSGLYCSYAPEARCGAADQTGVCLPRPDACTMQYDPVCGCDGQTYGNACSAASQGVSVAHAGECRP